MSDSIAALFQRLTQGAYVIGVAQGEVRNAFTAAWVMQVSFDPLLLALSINPHHRSYRLLTESGAFSVNVLGRGQLALAEHFGRPNSAGKMVGVELATSSRGLPLLADALAWFECQVSHEYPAGDHVLVVGRVVDGRLVDAQAEPMTYRQTGEMDNASALYPGKFDD